MRKVKINIRETNRKNKVYQKFPMGVRRIYIYIYIYIFTFYFSFILHQPVTCSKHYQKKQVLIFSSLMVQEPFVQIKKKWYFKNVLRIITVSLTL